MTWRKTAEGYAWDRYEVCVSTAHGRSQWTVLRDGAPLRGRFGAVRRAPTLAKAKEIVQRDLEQATVVYTLDEDDLHDRLCDLLAEVDIEGGWTDVGIGSYEYWGFRGYDSRLAVEIDAADTEIRVLEAPSDATLPETIKVTYSGGGCDGEHSGRCKPCCTPWEAEVAWHLSERQVRDGVLWVTYQPEQM